MVSPTLAGLEEHVMAPPRLLRSATRPYRPHWCRAGGHLGGLDQRGRQTRPTPSGSVFVSLPLTGASRSGTAELLLSEDQSEKSDVAEKVQRHVRPDSDINVALPKDRSDVSDHRKQDDHVSPRLPDVVEGEEDVLQERVFQRKREIRGIRYPRK
jgi:hypothetical protein